MLGVPGAGKTTVAKLLNSKLGAEHIWADLERRELLGAPKFTHDENIWLYDKLNQKTEALLSHGNTVIYDAAFNYRSDRLKMQKLASIYHATTVTIWVDTPHHIARERINVGSKNRVLGDMTLETFNALRIKLETPLEFEKHIRIDGTIVDSSTINQIESLLGSTY